MIRIIGVQRNEEIGGEFVLLQNQGSLKINLKGHIVASQTALEGGDTSDGLHVFTDDVDVHPGMYVLLRTCPGVGHWNYMQDRYSTYYAYMHRRTPVWVRHKGPLHVLSLQHSWVERKQEYALT